MVQNKFVMYDALLLTKKASAIFALEVTKFGFIFRLFLGQRSSVKNTENCALCACLMIRIRMKYQIDQSSFYLVLVPPRFLLNVCVSLIN